MLTVFLSINSAIIINWLSPEEKFSSHYFCEKRLEVLSEILHSRCAARSARPTLHFDNAAPHRSAATDNCFESCQFRHAPQHPYNPDISLYDFFLFGELKTKLKDEEFETMEQLQR
jgi:hypothetical protein